jgi:hypothetical protein
MPPPPPLEEINETSMINDTNNDLNKPNLQSDLVVETTQSNTQIQSEEQASVIKEGVK